MTNFGKLLFTIILIAILAVVVFFLNKKPVPIIEEPVNTIDRSMPILEESVKAKILGNKDDLISFSILPDTKVRGILSYRGVIKGGYFFEANILINILDMDKKPLIKSHATAQEDWMTVNPVPFEGNIDFTGLPTGPAYFEIHNDNPSDIRENDKSILIPIVIE